MNELLSRHEISHLFQWSTRPSRKPLIIRGARQVGKSTLVRQFASAENFSLLEINFERNPEYKEVFASKDPIQILSAINLLTGIKITAGKTLLFLDEIQAAPEALAALRYFYEEQPDLHVLAAGSLLEFALADAQFSMPVGRVEYFHIGPMQFEDFLVAMGQEHLAQYLKSLSLEDIRNMRMLKPVHEKCMNLLKQYWIVGGLPEAVALYARDRDFGELARVQQNIVATYRDDFNKYSQAKLKNHVQMVFDRLPAMVGHKFKYTQVSRDHRARELSDALNQLCMARIATKVYHTSANGVPLGAEINERLFKTLYMDIGLMCAALKLNVLDLDKDNISLINNGALAEQFVGQHLMYNEPYYTAPSLYYWVREAKSSAAEIDYLITSGSEIIPIEIKAGTTGSLKSLHQFLKEKKRNFGLRFNADVPSLLNDSKKLTNGTAINYDLLSLPLYMLGRTQSLTSDFLTEQREGKNVF